MKHLLKWIKTQKERKKERKKEKIRRELNHTIERKREAPWLIAM